MAIEFDEVGCEHNLLWSTDVILCMRSKRVQSEENDVVQIFRTPEGNYLGFAVGMRNTGEYLFMVCAYGAPVGFGKVSYLDNALPTPHIVNWIQYPITEPSENAHAQNIQPTLP